MKVSYASSSHGDGGEGVLSISHCDRIGDSNNLDLGEGVASSLTVLH